jgi:hypothetical protein
MNRAEVLDKAKAAVADREGKYGHPRENFERIARRWNVHLQNKHGNLGRNDLDADDVAIMLVDVKLARAESGVYHPDNFIDVAGYAALAAEIGAPFEQRDAIACTCGNRIAKDIHRPGCPLRAYYRGADGRLQRKVDDAEIEETIADLRATGGLAK